LAWGNSEKPKRQKQRPIGKIYRTRKRGDTNEGRRRGKNSLKPGPLYGVRGEKVGGEVSSSPSRKGIRGDQKSVGGEILGLGRAFMTPGTNPDYTEGEIEMNGDPESAQKIDTG